MLVNIIKTNTRNMNYISTGVTSLIMKYPKLSVIAPLFVSASITLACTTGLPSEVTFPETSCHLGKNFIGCTYNASNTQQYGCKHIYHQLCF